MQELDEETLALYRDLKKDPVIWGIQNRGVVNQDPTLQLYPEAIANSLSSALGEASPPPPVHSGISKYLDLQSAQNDGWEF